MQPQDTGFVSLIRERVLPSENRSMFWFRSDPPNVGDWIGPYLFHAITGQYPIFTKPKRWYVTSCFLTVGSVMHNIRRDGNAVVWGSGVLSAHDKFCRPKQVPAVRGPLSRERFFDQGYDCPEVYGDPAILMPRYYEAKPTSEKRGYGVIPHLVDCEIIHQDRPTDVQFIDVRQPVEQFIDAIASCDVTFSSSLHGLIVSHAYGVPSVLSLIHI